MAERSGVIYLLKDRFQLYSPFLSQIVEYKFPPDVVRDSDVMNKELLDTQVKMFVSNGKIQPSNLVIILADNAYFIKDFVLPPTPPPQKGQPPPQPQMTMETLHVMSMDFVEHVPYENVVSKTIPIKNGLKVCAVNKDYFDAVKDAFEGLKFTVTAVYPGFVLGNNLSTKPVLDGSLVNSVQQKTTALKQYDLLSQQVFVPEVKKKNGDDAPEPEEPVPEKSKTRLYLMLGVFGILLVVLGVVYTNSMQPPKQEEQPQPSAGVSAVSPAAPAVSTAVSPAAAAADAAFDPEEAKLLTVQLTNTNAPTSSVNNLRTALGKFNFASMNTQTQSSVTTPQTVITFSIVPSPQMRAAVLKEVKKITPNVQIQERSNTTADITILLSR